MIFFARSCRPDKMKWWVFSLAHVVYTVTSMTTVGGTITPPVHASMRETWGSDVTAHKISWYFGHADKQEDWQQASQWWHLAINILLCSCHSKKKEIKETPLIVRKCVDEVHQIPPPVLHCNVGKRRLTHFWSFWKVWFLKHLHLRQLQKKKLISLSERTGWRSVSTAVSSLHPGPRRYPIIAVIHE